MGGYRRYIGIVEKKMETTMVNILGYTIVYWGYIETVDKKMEAQKTEPYRIKRCTCERALSDCIDSLVTPWHTMATCNPYLKETRAHRN